MAHVEAQQSSQSNPCPPWCVRQHDHDHPDDRYHDSAALHVPAILLTRDPDAGPGQWSRDAGEITIVTSQHDSNNELVTFIGREDDVRQQLSLTPESAARLAEAITQHLESLHHPS